MLHRPILSLTAPPPEYCPDSMGNRLERLGVGAFGQVYEERDAEGRRTGRCVKIISIDPSAGTTYVQAVQEISLLAQLKHDNIVRYLGSDFGEDNAVTKEALQSSPTVMRIWMEQCDSTLLSAILMPPRAGGFYAEISIWRALRELSDALRYLHAMDVLHRDIKPGNVLRKAGAFKLGDFGLAKVLQATQQTTRSLVGTPEYMAPEVRARSPYGKPADVYSLGLCVLHVSSMALGPARPSPPTDAAGTVQALRSGHHYSVALCDLLLEMLSADPALRPTAEGLYRRACAAPASLADAERMIAQKTEARASLSKQIEELDAQVAELRQLISLQQRTH